MISDEVEEEEVESDRLLKLKPLKELRDDLRFDAVDDGRADGGFVSSPSETSEKTDAVGELLLLLSRRAEDEAESEIDCDGCDGGGGAAVVERGELKEEKEEEEVEVAAGVGEEEDEEAAKAAIGDTAESEPEVPRGLGFTPAV